MTSRIKVGQIVATLDWDGPGGGITRFAAELCQRLDPQAFEVELYALWRLDRPGEEATVAQLRRAGLAVHRATSFDGLHPYRGFWRALAALRPLVARQRPDILHSHHEFGDMAALALGGLAPPWRVVRTVHNLEWQRRPWRRRLLTNGLYPLAFAAEAGVSQEIVDRLNRRPLARLLDRRAHRLHNAINLTRFKARPDHPEAIRSGLGLAPEAFVIGTVGRLTEQKGYHHLLSAMALVTRHLPHARLVLVGVGRLEGALKAWAGQLGLERQVVFAGRRADVEALLPALDVFVSSSLWEGLPTVVLEAMAAGVPVIATDVVGTREVVVDGVNGRLVPAGDEQLLAEAIRQHYADPSAGQAWARAALTTVQGFSISSVAAEYEALYRGLLGRQ